jgi:hypothetical protein
MKRTERRVWFAVVAALAVGILVPIVASVSPAAATAAGAAASSVSVGLTASVVTTVVLPPDAAADSDAGFSQVVCPAPGLCLAVGEYVVGPAVDAGLVESTVAGVSVGTRLPQPGPGSVNVDRISCADATDCVAVGEFYPRDGSTGRVVVEQLRDGVWTDELMPLPPNTTDPAEPSITSLDCPTVEFCAAIGSANGRPGFVATWSDDQWSFTSTEPMNELSCGSPTFCVAVGERAYTGGSAPETDTWDGASWTLSDAPLPADVAVDENVSYAYLNSVSCSSPTVCHAVGGYDATGADGRPLLETLSSGTWTPSALPTPAGDTTAPWVWNITCPTDTFCAAGIDDSTLESVLAVDTMTNGVWTATALPPPSDLAAPGLGVNVDHLVQCPRAGYCVVEGTVLSDYDGTGDFQEQYQDGRWTSSLEGLPLDASATPNVQSGIVAGCSVGSTCESTFEYAAATGGYHVAVVSTVSVTPPPAFAIAAIRHGRGETYVRTAGSKARWRRLGGSLDDSPSVVAYQAADGNLKPMYIGVNRRHQIVARRLNGRWQIVSSARHCASRPAASLTGLTLDLICIGPHHHLVEGSATVRGGRVEHARWSTDSTRKVVGRPAVIGGGASLRVLILDGRHRVLEQTRLARSFRVVAHGCWSDLTTASTPSRASAVIACKNHAGTASQWANDGNGWKRIAAVSGSVGTSLGIAATSGRTILVTTRRHTLRLLAGRHWTTLTHKIVSTTTAVALN